MVLKITTTDGVWIDMLDDLNKDIIDYNELRKNTRLAVFYLKHINLGRFWKLGFKYHEV